jgi:cyclopropane fatty-acyl-phospholipid synthase-like methyltransferase
MRSAKEAALLERFEASHERMRSPVMTAIERRVCGCDYGGSSWTTRSQVEQMSRQLGLRTGVQLLELGAGSGWPGLYFAKTTGCQVALVDVPFSGLRIAAERAATEDIGERVRIIAADASLLPFANASFDAISHCDLLCCLKPKHSVLLACRQLIQDHGQMVFTVISVAPGLTGSAYRRAVENGPDFIETEGDYRDLLADTGWVVTSCENITDEYAASCHRQIDADIIHKNELVALIGPDEYEERLAGWRSKLIAVNEGLLRREIFVAAPRTA